MAANTGGTLWVVDARGQEVGVVIRRGGDDGRSGGAIYDRVTLFDPPSGLFFDVTMADGVVRYPTTTYFSDSHCGQPVGIAAGACGECVAGFGIGFVHQGAWWRVVGGASVTQIAMGSTLGGGISETCVAHGTSSAKGYPVEPVAEPTPPAEPMPPLRYVWVSDD